MMKRLTAAALCVFLLTGLLGGCQIDPPLPSESAGTDVQSQTGTGDLAFQTGATYEDVRIALTQTYGEKGGMAIMGAGAAVDMMEAETSSMPASTSSVADEIADGNSNYSETNVQVAGIDEGDIVKTDGEQIYILRDNVLTIAKADGADTQVLSQTDLGSEAQSYESFYEMYLSGNTIALVASGYDDSVSFTGTDAIRTMLYLYDVSNPEAPVFRGSLGQDGYYQTSRMVGDTAYLISNYWIYTYNDSEDDIGDFIPCLYAESDVTRIPEGCIAIMPAVNSTVYSVVTAYDVATGEVAGAYTVLGGTSTVYMNSENLYLACERYESTTGESYTEDLYTVTEYKSSHTTDIIRLDIATGVPAVAASGSVPGSLNDQFSMDEWDGHLRLVATVYNYGYRVYEDESRGFINSEILEDTTANALYILNCDLQVTGSVENLAEDETIYSARFDGAVGYFVTFRLVDPLFAVDLSDPANPTVLSALKIPGFSQYLHVYGDGRLFGLGREANEVTGTAGNLKLSMFNTEDPTDVTEMQTLILDSAYSEALYNHKAILISQKKNIIAFPVAVGYAVYGYTDADGFFLKGEIVSEGLGYNTRGLYIGDTAYIIDEAGIRVLDLDGLSELTFITY